MNVIHLLAKTRPVLTHSSFIPKALLLLTGAIAASAQQYIAVDLTPNAPAGSMANAVSSGVAGGSVMTLNSSNVYVQHAALFANGTTTDFHPPSWTMSTITGISGGQQVGLGLPVASADASTGTHAILWNGLASAFIDLQPSGYVGSAAYCTNGSQQGGSVVLKGSGGKVKTAPPNHAALWNGAPSRFADLNPVGAAESKIYGCDLSQQSGYIASQPQGFTHAALWSGSAASAIDLQPQSGFVSSIAFATSNGFQVGYGVTDPSAGGAGHALVWTGTPASVIDLHPAGYTFSVAFATNGQQHVGEADDAQFPRHKHAVVWTGISPTVVDLNQFLPAGFTDAQAMGIDASGKIAGYANGHAFLWVPVL